MPHEIPVPIQRHKRHKRKILISHFRRRGQRASSIIMLCVVAIVWCLDPFDREGSALLSMNLLPANPDLEPYYMYEGCPESNRTSLKRPVSVQQIL